MLYGYNSGGQWAASKDRKPTEEYSRWATMMSRCCNPKNRAYPRYGGKGVTVCDEWQDFQVFAQWYSETHKDGWVMDKDLLGGNVYGPSTVVWLPDQINQLVRCLGAKGYTVVDGYISSSITTRGKREHLGMFSSTETAREAYMCSLRSKIRRIVSDTEGLTSSTVEALLSV